MPSSHPQALGFHSESEAVIVRRVSRRVAHYLEDLSSRSGSLRDALTEAAPPPEFADEAPTQVLRTRKDDGQTSLRSGAERSPESVITLPGSESDDFSLNAREEAPQRYPEVTLAPPRPPVDGLDALSQGSQQRRPDSMQLSEKGRKGNDEVFKKGVTLKIGGAREAVPSPATKVQTGESAPLPDFPRLPDLEEFGREFALSHNEGSETRKSFVVPQDLSEPESSEVAGESTVTMTDSNMSQLSGVAGVDERHAPSVGISGKQVGLLIGLLTVVALGVVYYLLTFEKFIY